MKLSITQRNQLNDLLIAAGLQPEKFDWEKAADGFSLEATRMRLKRAGKPQYFEINREGLRSELGYNCWYQPGAETVKDEKDNIPWAMVVIHFKNWCSMLERENTGKDRWEDIIKQLSAVQIRTQPTDEQAMSGVELSDIQNRMSALKQKIENLPLPELYQQLISTTLNRVAANAQNLNKFDWKSLFAGTIANLVSTLEITPPVAEMFWRCAREEFGDFLTSP